MKCTASAHMIQGAIAYDDHGENWFMLAPAAKTAGRLHERGEEYAPGDLDAELILRSVESEISLPIDNPKAARATNSDLDPPPVHFAFLKGLVGGIGLSFMVWSSLNHRATSNTHE